MPVTVEEVKAKENTAAASASEDSQLFSDKRIMSLEAVASRYCPGNCMFLICCCAQEEMVQVTITDGEVVS
jgi:hypothetical protein